MNQEIISGYKSIESLINIIKNYNPQKIFLVTGKESFTISGAEKNISDILKKFKFIRFSDFSVNPKCKDIEKGIMNFKDEECDMVVGIGGGSVMDVAKAISICATNDRDLDRLLRGTELLKSRIIPSIMIPTTAGTGSESTHFSVVYIDKIKYSLAHSSMLPDYALLDPVFTESVAPHIAASTGMDALCQGIESFWSINSTEESRGYSREAIKLALSSIVKAVNSGDIESRSSMLMASNYAGRAINIAQTTAAHAVSYPITSYFNVAHGHAVALTLPHFIEFNSLVTEKNVQDSRGVDFVKNIMNELLDILEISTAVDGKNVLLKIMRDIGLTSSLSGLQICSDDIEIIVENGFNPQRVKNNPRILTRKNLTAMLENIL